MGKGGIGGLNAHNTHVNISSKKKKSKTENNSLIIKINVINEDPNRLLYTLKIELQKLELV